MSRPPTPEATDALDPCLSVVEAHHDFDASPLLDFLIRFTALAKRTPRERILRAVAEELEALCRRTLEALQTVAPAGDLRSHALAALEGALHAYDSARPETASFPATALQALRAEAARTGAEALAAEAVARGLSQHAALQERVSWLLNGTSREEMARLDPVRDSDRIYHALMSSFRVESRVLELLAINRVAQSEALSLFVRSTRESETRPVERFYDTYALFANYFEWGEESRRGRAVISRMNGIHGRYLLPNDGMKYVLLETAFTWLDGAERLGHRPLTPVERRGYFHAHVRMGRAMDIAGLSDDYEAMYAWYREYNRTHAAPSALKRDTFETFVTRSLGESALPPLRDALFLAARVGMDSDYLSALGYPAPTADETRAVRAVLFTLGGLLESLPPTAYVRSLQNNPARSGYTRPEGLGVSARSAHLPVLDAAQPNGGHPQGVRPLGRPEDAPPVDLPFFGWDEIQRHASPESLWVVLDGEVYDLTGWARHHPGGLEVLMRWAGKDATETFRAAPHSAATQVFKLNYRIGRLTASHSAG